MGSLVSTGVHEGKDVGEAEGVRVVVAEGVNVHVGGRSECTSRIIRVGNGVPVSVADGKIATVGKLVSPDDAEQALIINTKNIPKHRTHRCFMCQSPMSILLALTITHSRICRISDRKIKKGNPQGYPE